MAAIAYVAPPMPIAFRAGATLVLDASDPAIRARSTNRDALNTLFNRRVRLFSYPGLHAKVLVLGRTAVIGSMNLSNHSQRRLIEAGIVTDHPQVVGDVVRFIESLIGNADEIKQPFLDRIATLRLAPRHGLPSGVRAHRPAEVPRSASWLLNLEPGWDQAGPKGSGAEKGHQVAKRRLPPEAAYAWY